MSCPIAPLTCERLPCISPLPRASSPSRALTVASNAASRAVFSSPSVSIMASSRLISFMLAFLSSSILPSMLRMASLASLSRTDANTFRLAFLSALLAEADPGCPLESRPAPFLPLSSDLVPEASATLPSELGSSSAPVAAPILRSWPVAYRIGCLRDGD
jgi:hypothetical protein